MNVIIFIPSYKRSEVLNLTLQGILKNHLPDHNVTVCVGDNKYSDSSKRVLENYEKLYKDKNINYDYLLFEDNLGKAVCLNTLYEKYYKKEDIIITMDNDMVIKKPWYHYFDIFKELNYDLMGVASRTFWMHLPDRKNSHPVKYKDFTKYYPLGIAGGLLLLKPDFLSKHKWSNHGGVYGEDDAGMVAKTSNRGVLEWDLDWLDHDPLMGTTPELEHYKNKKLELLNRKQYIFPKGWDD